MTDHSPDTGNMVDRADALEALALRCEAGEASREMDALIAVALRRLHPRHAEHAPWVANFPTWRARPEGKVAVVHHDGNDGVHWDSEPVTRSLDAVSALQEAVLPHWFLSSSSSGVACATPPDAGLGGQKIHTGHRHPKITECQARLAALLRALAVEIREGRS